MPAPLVKSAVDIERLPMRWRRRDLNAHVPITFDGNAPRQDLGQASGAAMEMTIETTASRMAAVSPPGTLV